jgi:hypothetical protein
MYEIIVETGPLASHATTSKIGFLISGEDGETGVRSFNDPEKILFKHHKQYVPFQQGAKDAFLMTTDHPLGKVVNKLIIEVSKCNVSKICLNTETRNTRPPVSNLIM